MVTRQGPRLRVYHVPKLKGKRIREQRALWVNPETQEFRELGEMISPKDSKGELGEAISAPRQWKHRLRNEVHRGRTQRGSSVLVTGEPKRDSS